MRSAPAFVVSVVLLGAGCECGGEPHTEPAVRSQGAPPPAQTPQRRCVKAAGPVEDRYLPVVRALCAEQHQHGVPGVALAIAEGGKLRLSIGSGIRCRGRADRVTATTPFRIGSLTKMFTAATAVALDDAGTVSLDAPIGELVGELRTISPQLAGLPLSRFLDHTAGLADVMPTADNAELGERALLRAWTEEATVDAGPTFRYANTGYYLTGLALERATGSELQSLVQRHVLAPHDIEASFDAVAVRDSAACGHLRIDGRDEVLDVARDFQRHAHGATWTLPAGGIITDAPALAAFAIGPGSAMLAERAIATAVPTDDPGDRYALGVHVRTLDDGRTVLYHRGSTGDFYAELHWIPKSSFAVAVVGNTGAPLRATIHAALSLANAEPRSR